MRIISTINRCPNSNLTFSMGMFLTLLCYLILGCGKPSQNEQWRIAELKTSGSGETTDSAVSVKKTSSLPLNAEVNRSVLRPMVETFTSQQPQNLNSLNATTVSKSYSLTHISNCDLDVLKAFIAKGWSPIVSLRRTGNKPQLWAMVGYDAMGQIHLENPVNNRRRAWAEKDFMTQWTLASDDRCALITPGSLDQAKVQQAISRHLPESKVAQVRVSRSLQGRAPAQR